VADLVQILGPGFRFLFCSSQNEYIKKLNQIKTEQTAISSYSVVGTSNFKRKKERKKQLQLLF
jgi:hypothetical protein